MPESRFKNWFEEFLYERYLAYSVTYENEAHKALCNRITEINYVFQEQNPSLFLELDELSAEAEGIRYFAMYRRGFWTGYELAKILEAGEQFPLAGRHHLEAQAAQAG